MSFIRRFKPAYAFYNLFQHRRLAHNATLYQKLGLRKSYFSSVSSQDFAHLPARPSSPGPSLAERLVGNEAFEALPAAAQASLLGFDAQGFAVLPGFFSPERVEAINTALEKLVATGQLKFRYRNKLMLAFEKSPLIRQAAEDPQLRTLLTALLGHEARLFQSINFLSGSEQHTHSDSIHMSTYPLGGLIAAWVALEDITPENGPLHYFPGSHQLPYYLNADYDNQGSAWFIGAKDYSAYEDFIKQRVADLGLKKQVFLAKKGDIFIWHANLLHGGEPQTNKDLTRKSMVLHYFSPDHICYHEITQRPALLAQS
ncbi:phytanoyl-CoA dioxygenase family protein [Hymenobacter bucti]|uniref:Phytanoyl-CoA dioxygenase family protein n=1 Tax=Hymenobacter bucti TaxID=1844114 RepID=A0ABW4QU65_9BACT